MRRGSEEGPGGCMCVPQDDAAAQSAWRRPARAPATNFKNHSSCLRSNDGVLYAHRAFRNGPVLAARCRMSV